MKQNIPARTSAAKVVGGLLAVLVATVFAAGPATADDRGHRRDEHERYERYERHERQEHWRGDIHRFHEHDLGLWRGGRWHHGLHDGRSGWWWIVGGTWYFYPAPVYPYPDPYLPPGAVAPLSGTQQYWYYCTNPAGYYPYVPQCATTWQAVPENPPASPPAPVAPAPEQYWYYCYNPPGYYPTVPRCPSGWQRVPATR